jgi:hypothetical protein
MNENTHAIRHSARLHSLLSFWLRRDRSVTNRIPDAMKELDAQLERKLRFADWTPPLDERYSTLVEEPRQRPPQPPKRSRIDELKDRISRRGEHVDDSPLDGEEGVRVNRWEEGETCLSQGQTSTQTCIHAYTDMHRTHAYIDMHRTAYIDMHRTYKWCICLAFMNHAVTSTTTTCVCCMRAYEHVKPVPTIPIWPFSHHPTPHIDVACLCGSAHQCERCVCEDEPCTNTHITMYKHTYNHVQTHI